MPTLYSDQTLSAQTAYAQLFDAALGAESLRGIADLAGSFASKVVAGKTYWYFQTTEPSGKLHQIYVGPDGAQLRVLIEKKKAPGSLHFLLPLARSAIALGCEAVVPQHLRVIRRLADYGFFKAGGVLIGTHAFLSYANSLGVRWGDVSRTQDIDFAHAGKKVSLVLPSTAKVDTSKAIESLGMGFLPVSGLGGKTGAAYLIPHQPEFRLDFLTPLHRGGTQPYEHPQLHVSLQPLPFMEFSLEDIQQSVLFCPEGAVLVNLPSVERYAVHKLLIYGERSGQFRTKSAKDLRQVACLMELLWTHRREPLLAALADAQSRGKGWQLRLRQGAAALAKGFGDAVPAPLLKRIAK